MAAWNPASTSVSRSSRSPRQAADRTATARCRPGMAMPVSPITHAGPPPRGRRTSSAHTLLRALPLAAGCSSMALSSSSGTRRSGSPRARRAGLRAKGRGPVTSARNAASALSSGPSPYSSVPTVSGAPGQSRAGAAGAWRSGIAAPRGREFAVFPAPMNAPALDLSWTCDIPSGDLSRTCHVLFAYPESGRHSPLARLAWPLLRPGVPRPTARKVQSASCLRIFPAGYIGGTSQVHRRC
jgi:hypothetical protein